MRKSLTSRTLGMLAVFVFATATVVHALDAKQLVEAIETQYQSGSAHGTARMKIVTDAWTRELKMEVWGKGREKFLTRILEPKKEAGIGTLKIGDDIWNYLPKIDRLMKVPSSLMGEGWMGSHFTNDDLVKEAKIDQLYTFDILYQDATTAVIQATPEPDAVVVWGKLIYVADHQRMIPIRVDYYDEDGVRVRTAVFSDVQTIDGREIPMRMRVAPADAPEEYTELIYESLNLDAELPSNLFSTRSLRQR